VGDAAGAAAGEGGRGPGPPSTPRYTPGDGEGPARRPTPASSHASTARYSSTMGLSFRSDPAPRKRLVGFDKTAVDPSHKHQPADASNKVRQRGVTARGSGRAGGRRGGGIKGRKGASTRAQGTHVWTGRGTGLSLDGTPPLRIKQRTEQWRCEGSALRVDVGVRVAQGGPTEFSCVCSALHTHQRLPPRQLRWPAPPWRPGPCPGQ
jgi:hypothetical protein